MADVFVSYSRSDKARVAPLVAAVEACGWSVWWDPHIAPGQEFDQLIDAELAIAGSVLVVWTRDSVASRWVRGEAREAADRGILVPVRFDDAVLPIDVRAIHTIDLDDAAGKDDVRIQEVLHALGGLIARRSGSAGRCRTFQGTHDKAQVADPACRHRADCDLRPAVHQHERRSRTGLLSDGLSEDIITELSRWHMLAVRSRAASFRYRGAAVDMHEVARELQVRFIVEGSVRRMGERVRITAQLIDAEAGHHVWAEKFDRALADIFAVQDEVVQTIVSTLVGRVQACDAERARRKPPASLAAYECVLKGNALPWDTPEGTAEATRLFEQAIALDPGYGFAHALLAAMRYNRWYDAAIGDDAGLDEGYALAKRGVDLDPDESTCHSIFAQVLHLQRKFDLSLLHARRAVELNPSNQWNAADMGMMLNYAGQPEEALTWFQRAREIDPYFEEPWYWREYGLSYLLLHRYEEALAKFNLLPAGKYRYAAVIAACQARLGNTERARFHAQECLAIRPGFTISHFLAKTPFRNPADAAHLAESMRLAGLPA